MVKLKHNIDIRVKYPAPKPKTPRIESISSQIIPIPKIKTISLRRNNNASLPTISHNLNNTQDRQIKRVEPRTNHKLEINKTTRQVPNTKSRIENKSAEQAPRPVLKIKNIGAHKILIIVANGPSHKEAELSAFKEHKNIDILSINRPDSRIWPTRYWAFFDSTQYRRHKELWDSFNGIIINSSSMKDRKPNSINIKSLSGKGFSKDLTRGLFIGRSSTYACLQIGLWMNYDHIYVFGCDMGKVGGKLYEWGSNPDVKDDVRINRFKNEADNYDWFAKNSDRNVRDKITFCSTYNNWDFVKKFEQLNHIEAVRVILDRHSNIINKET